MKYLIIVDNYGTQNNGVMAMGVTFITQIRKIYPDATITFFSLPKYCQVDRIRYASYNVSVLNLFWVPSNIYPGKLTDIILFLYFSIYMFVCTILPEKFIKKDALCFKNSDAILSLCGEDLLSDNCRYQLLLRQFFPFIISRIFKKPYIVLGQTIGPFRKILNRRLFKHVLNNAALITARDKRSFELCKKGIGRLRHNNVYFTSDIAFLMHSAENAGTLNLLEGESVKTDKSRKKLGLSVSRLFAVSAFKVLSKNDRYRAFVKKITEFCDYVGSVYNIDILLIPHVTVDYGDDRKVGRDILGMCEHKSNIYALEKEYKSDEIKGMIKLCDYFIGCRMHSLVASLSLNVPSIALAYSDKTMDLIGPLLNRKYVIDARNETPETFLEKLKASFGHLMENRDTVVSGLKKNIPEEQKKSLQNFELLRKLLS